MKIIHLGFSFQLRNQLKMLVERMELITPDTNFKLTKFNGTQIIEKR